MENLPLFIWGFYTSQVVITGFLNHQQYEVICYFCRQKRTPNMIIESLEITPWVCFQFTLFSMYFPQTNRSFDSLSDWFFLRKFWWFSCSHTVDGRNPAPADMENLPLFVGLYTSQVVIAGFLNHQQYGLFFFTAKARVERQQLGWRGFNCWWVAFLFFSGDVTFIPW